MLKKAIGYKTLLFLSINGILGTGIFFLPAIGAGIAGPASILSWLVMSAVALGIAFYFAELSRMFPKSGGPYEYSKQAFGLLTGFIVGWTSWIVSNITIAMVLVGSFRYLFAGIGDMEILMISILTILVLNYVSYRGIGLSSTMLLLFGIITVGTLTVLVFPGLFTVNLANFTPFIVSDGYSIFLAVFFIAETFFGWETVTYLSEEAKNPKDVPKALLFGTAAIVVISLGVVFVSLGNVNWEVFSQSRAPLALLSTNIFGSLGSLFSLIIFVPLIGTAATWIISSPRLLYAMSRDKVFPSGFSRIHTKNATPYMAIAFQTIVTIFVIILALGSYEILLSLLLPLVLFVYSVTLLVVVKKKRKLPPLAIVLFNALLLLVWLNTVPNGLRLLTISVLLVLTGFPAYLLIRIETSSQATEKFFNRFSFLWDKAFPIWYGKKEMNRVVRNAHIKKGDKVLDFGCATGYTTKAVANKVGKKGKVVAVDMSEAQLKRAVRRISKDIKMSNVLFVKTLGKVPFEEDTFDAVTLVGVLEYFNQPKKQLKSVLKCLKKGGHLSAMSFGKALGVPPQDYLKSKKSTKDLFKKAGMDVKVKKTKRRGTEYWFIWGKK